MENVLILFIGVAVVVVFYYEVFQFALACSTIPDPF